jgi:predicted transcriptional regulator YdeE
MQNMAERDNADRDNISPERLEAGEGSIFERYTEDFGQQFGRGGIEIWVPIRK